MERTEDNYDYEAEEDRCEGGGVVEISDHTPAEYMNGQAADGKTSLSRLLKMNKELQGRLAAQQVENQQLLVWAKEATEQAEQVHQWLTMVASSVEACLLVASINLSSDKYKQTFARVHKIATTNQKQTLEATKEQLEKALEEHATTLSRAWQVS